MPPAVPPAGQDTSAGRTSRTGAKAASVVFGLALLASLVEGFLLPDKAAVVAVAAPVLLAAMAFTRLDLFESFKGAGIEVKMREIKDATEGAREAKAEAEAILEQLRTVTAATVTVTLNLLAREGMLGTTPLIRKIEMRDALLTSLKFINCTDEQLTRTAADFRTWCLLSHANKVRDAALKKFDRQRSTYKGDFNVLFKAFQSRLDGGKEFGKSDRLSPDWYRATVISQDMMDDEIEALILAYEHFEKYDTLRLPDQVT